MTTLGVGRGHAAPHDARVDTPFDPIALGILARHAAGGA
jgi:hypothetical protein